MDELDDKLIDHIRGAFENFDDSGADEGWLLLREKFPEKEKDRRVLWLWLASAAAILLLALGIGTWYANQKTKPEKLITRKQQPAKRNNDTPVKTSIAKQPDLDNNDTVKSRKPSSIFDKAMHHKQMPQAKQHQNTEDENTNNTTAPIGTAAITPSTTDNIAQQPAVAAKSNDTAPVKKEPALQKQEKPFWLSNTTEDKPKKNDEKSGDKKVKFSLYAATYFNYAKGSDNQINVGAGFASDIKLTKNIKLSTGIALAQNTLNYVNNSPTQAIQNNALAYAYSSGVAAGYTNNTPVIKNYNALLVGLDIPLNIKYEFNPQKNSSFLSVGISSGTFLNQTYTYNYNLPALAASQQQQPQTETAHSFSDFYFAKTLNISFGVGYPLGKKNHLIIEPFLKYPLAGLGSQQIYFGAGGLNLKFDFQSAKK